MLGLNGTMHQTTLEHQPNRAAYRRDLRIRPQSDDQNGQ